MSHDRSYRSSSKVPGKDVKSASNLSKKNGQKRNTSVAGKGKGAQKTLTEQVKKINKLEEEKLRMEIKELKKVEESERRLKNVAREAVSLVSQTTSDSSAVLVKFDIGHVAQVIAAFVAKVTAVVNDPFYDDQIVGLSIYFREALQRYPRNGLYPKRLLDISAALHGVAPGKFTYNAEFNVLGDIPSQTNNAASGVFMFNRAFTRDANGYYLSAVLPTTYVYDAMQKWMRKCEKELKVREASEYVSKFAGDMSVYADISTAPLTADDEYVLKGKQQVGLTPTVQQLEVVASSEYPIKTPWLANLRLFLGSRYRQRNHTIHVSGTPAGTIWCLMNKQYYKYAARHMHKVVNLSSLHRRVVKLFEAANKLNPGVTELVGKRDFYYWFLTVVYSRFNVFIPSQYGLGSVNNTGFNIGVGNLPPPLSSVSKVPEYLARNLVAYRPTVANGILWIPAVDSSTYDVQNYIESKWSTTDILPALAEVISVTVPALDNSNFPAILINVGNALAKFNGNFRIVQLGTQLTVTKSIMSYMQHRILVGGTLSVVGIMASEKTRDSVEELCADYELPYVLQTTNANVGDDVQTWALMFRHPFTKMMRPQLVRDYIDADVVDEVVAAGVLTSNVQTDLAGIQLNSDWRVHTKDSLDEHLDLIGLTPDDVKRVNYLICRQDGTSQLPPVYGAVSDIVPTYGRYGGPNWSAGMRGGKLTRETISAAPPDDLEDAYYLIHDLEYGVNAGTYGKQEADEALKRRLDQLGEKGKLSTFGTLARHYFRQPVGT